MRTVTLLLLLNFCCSLLGQEEFRIAFYNTENLYDTIRNEKINDEDFTPEGHLHWNTHRYNQKIESIGQVLSSMGESYPPALIGLCEIENETVIKDLLSSRNMQAHNYKFTMTKSLDARGSNVALLYQRDQFRLITKRTYRPKLEDSATTRDILHVCGEVVSGDTLDVFVCHFPSRLGGQKKSEPNRISVASLLYKMVIKVQEQRAIPRIIIMGDFNDIPGGTVYQYLKCSKEANNSNLLVSLIDDRQNSNGIPNDKETDEEGKIKSYYYQGKWYYYDHFLVSRNLMDRHSTCFVDSKSASVYAPDFILETDDKYKKKKPLRAFLGWKYLGGYSDHLPIYINLQIKE